MRHFNPQSYREDENTIRMTLLEEHEITYNAYLNAKTEITWKTTGKPEKVNYTNTFSSITQPVKGVCRKKENIHAEYQDRKKKRKTKI